LNSGLNNQIVKMALFVCLFCSAGNRTQSLEHTEAFFEEKWEIKLGLTLY
jgi:hypothetical protein